MILTKKDKLRLLDKRWRMEHLYRIQDKEGRIVQFQFNDEQKVLFDRYKAKKERSTEFGLREAILKNRQIGITTFHCIYLLDDVIWNKGRTAAIIAHEREALEKIFRKVKFAYESMPVHLRPRALMENRRELSFEDISSNIYIALRVRSGTVHALHVSESAYIKDQRELKSGSYQAVPKSGDITSETTGNGYNQFHADWLGNKESQIWTNHFFPWVMHKDYFSRIKKTISLHDDYLIKGGCTALQMNWWYIKLEEIRVSDSSVKSALSLIKQEYPLTEDDAFITMGGSVFGEDIQDYPQMKALPRKDIDIKKLCQFDESIEDPDEHIINERDLDFLRLYDYPVKDERYCIGADTSGGFSDSDYSSAWVINSKTRALVLEWHGRIDPDLFGVQLLKMARCYNEAFLGIEVNNHGLTTINEIKDEYANLYRRERRDKITNELTKHIGWNTSSKSKDELIDEIKRNLRNRDVPAIPEPLRKELSTFIRKENGTLEAETGCYDDRVMSLGITLMMVRYNPFYEIKQKQNKYMGRELKYNRRK